MLNGGKQAWWVTKQLQAINWLIDWLVPLVAMLDVLVLKAGWFLPTGVVTSWSLLDATVVVWLVLVLTYYFSRGRLSYRAYLSLKLTLAMINLMLNPLALTTVLMVVGLLMAIWSQSVSQVVIEQPVAAKDYALLTLINNLDNGIVKVDNQLVVELYNAASLAILDTNQTLTGQSLLDVLKLVDLNQQPVDLIKLITNTKKTTVFDELIYQYANGEQLRLELTVSPIKNVYGVAEDDNYLLMLRDVTKIKNLEQERDEFISVISHELRTPISIMEANLSNLELMLERQVEPALISKNIAKTHQQVIYLANLTNDLSALSRAQRSELVDKQEIDLIELAHQLFDKYQSQVLAKGLKFDLDLDQALPRVKTNLLYLEEILQNFLTNAIKYTEQGGITLCFRQTAQVVELAVIDTGIGIAKSDQSKVFDKFYRVEDFQTRSTSGNGLGLYVAKKLANKLGLELRFKSRLKFGSTFSLVIPKSRKRR